jgi:transposase
MRSYRKVLERMRFSDIPSVGPREELKIVSLYLNSDTLCKDIAKRFRISPATVSNILTKHKVQRRGGKSHDREETGDNTGGDTVSLAAKQHRDNHDT